jgi:hypothetical protein
MHERGGSCIFSIASSDSAHKNFQSQCAQAGCYAWITALHAECFREVDMSDLERSLNQIIEEHIQESGLHVVGGQKRLARRLAQFIEEEIKEKYAEQPQSKSA